MSDQHATKIPVNSVVMNGIRVLGWSLAAHCGSRPSRAIAKKIRGWPYWKTSSTAVSETTAFLMSTMLSDVINAGTAYKARADGFTLPAAGKTGTTNDLKDLSVYGYLPVNPDPNIPVIVSSVWMGNSDGSPILATALRLKVPLTGLNGGTAIDDLWRWMATEDIEQAMRDEARQELRSFATGLGQQHQITVEERLGTRDGHAQEVADENVVAGALEAGVHRLHPHPLEPADQA